ncbi:MAG: thioredoxin domain-containing protein [Halobacteriovoraceae bacterium]|nr:thioredoxin domain-containing protein [Halobacteriovoraceae bacterium]
MLKHEKSPYLFQHRDNPVWWHPWGEDAFAKARKKNLPIFLSIGYSTCHWCHVMEKESFRDEDVAKILNENFISIKVDREERPDVDKIYMDAVSMMGIRGGWPLTLVLTPELVPFWGGTYLPKDHLIMITKRIANSWSYQKDKIRKHSYKMIDIFNKQLPQKNDKKTISPGIFNKMINEMEQYYDEKYGGFGNAPKFPPSMRLRMLLRMIHKEKNSEQKIKMTNMVEKTLTQMYKGGIYDHVGGGFHRYSVDDKWLVPHFEKMLYDNALLAITYLEAYQVTQKKFYSNVAKEILHYVMRDMMNKDGGFYSAEDADSEGKEGVFYLWSNDEIKKILSEEEYNLMQETYKITQEGNHEGKNLINLIHMKEKNLPEVFDGKIRSIMKKLFTARKKRIHPLKDDKILTAWNGLMIASMAKAYQIFQEKKYLDAAIAAANFIKKHLDSDGELKRRHRLGESRFPAYLDDYAYLISALLILYESDFDKKWIIWAKDLQERQNKNLWVESLGAYRFAIKNKNLIRETIEFTDNAKPNSNGVSLDNLLHLHALTYEEDYLKKSERLAGVLAHNLRSPYAYFAKTISSLDYYQKKSKEIAIIGSIKHPVTQRMIELVQKSFYPYKGVAYSQQKAKEDLASLISVLEGKTILSGRPTAYVCRKKVCQRPVNTVYEFKRQLDK